MKMMILHKITTLTCVASVMLASAGVLAAADRDDQIEDAFKNSYVYRTQLKDTGVSVDADSGMVTLTGKVENEDQKRLAEDTVRGLPGVARIDNQITVTNQPRESSDDWIAMKVRGSLLFHRNVSLRDTDVRVSQGVVTLTGVASSQAEKALAAEYANDVKGVQRVDNQLKVVEAARDARNDAERSLERAGDRMDRGARTAGEKIDDASITAQMKYALGVRRSTSALKTEVTTQDGVVTIRGEAQNGAEKDLVTHLAKDIDGVRDVRNEMTVRR